MRREDPRRAIIEVMARLGKETQLHIDERERHFDITDFVTIIVSVLLVVLAIFNIYYVRVLYEDLNGIVTSMESILHNVENVNEEMLAITQSIDKYDQHVANMGPVTESLSNMAVIFPKVSKNMKGMRESMTAIDHDMGLMSNAMNSIDKQMMPMKNGMGMIRHNVRAISGPMGLMNRMMP